MTNDGSVRLSRADRRELSELLAELIVAVRGGGPMPSQQPYWSEILDNHRKWMDRLAMTGEELADMATHAYNRATYGSEDEPHNG